ncbi:DUF3168 domain-containing protein [Rhodobacteraceae bacterium WD3A24]|nr:DUF3168 domain-containing protein [Rhodobacteraceae bacterium WD3A24]
MSYAISRALQEAVYQHLAADAALAALVGGVIHDAVPPGEAPSLYVLLGPEEVRDRSDVTGPGADHDFTVSVVSDAAGFDAAKQTAAAVSDALVDAPLSLTRGRLVGLWFRRARAERRDGGTRRRIEMTFRARVEG